MKKYRRLFIHLRSFITLLGLLCLAIVLFYFSNGVNIQNLLSLTPAANPKELIVPPPPSQFNGWVAWWDESDAITSLNKSSSKMTSLSPLWYKIDEQGKLQKIPHQAASIAALAQRSNIKLIPAVGNDFDPRRTSKIINNSDLTRDFMEELVNLATSSNYQGFDIDWEEIDPKDQQAFTIFIQKLADYLHTYNLQLTVSVPAQTGRSGDRAINKGYDLTTLGQSADAIKVMAYDFHSQNSAPGAITPRAELEKVLKYTTSVVPAVKLILGLPTYGYDWEISSNKKAAAVTFTQASEIVKKYGGQVSRDPESSSLIGSYNLDGQKHIIWFEDAETIGKMVKLSREKGIYQFSFWRIGAEDPKMWDELPP